MKKKIKSLIPILFIAARRLTVRSCGYPCKNPSKEQMVFYRKNQRGEDAAKQLRGYKNTLLMEDLGEPNGCLLGMWAISGRRILPILPSFTAILTVLLNTSLLEVKHSEALFRRTERSVKAASSEYK